MNRMPDSGYDDIWFEGQATQTGNKFMNEKGLR
jgi:hypothetical protein